MTGMKEHNLMRNQFGEFHLRPSAILFFELALMALLLPAVSAVN